MRWALSVWGSPGGVCGALIVGAMVVSAGEAHGERDASARGARSLKADAAEQVGTRLHIPGAEGLDVPTVRLQVAGRRREILSSARPRG